MREPKNAAPIDTTPDAGSATGLTRREFVSRGAAAAALIGAAPEALAAPSSAPIYRIHPAIGVARVGDADPSTFFIGPEIPGTPPAGEAPGTAVPPYKADGKVKPQAARFRVYEYAVVGGLLTPVREVTLDTPGVAGIRWSVHLANRKAAFNRFAGPAGESTPPATLRNAAVQDRRSLEIDFGGRTISGASQGPVEFRAGTSGDPSQESCPLGADGRPVIDYLGQLRTDAAGRLICLGGKGRAACNTATPTPLDSYANNDGWFDDVSDGPVTATVLLRDGAGTREVPVDSAGGAWLLCAPPDFAPEVGQAVNLYDLLYDLAVRALPLPANALYASGGPLANLRALKEGFRSDQEVEFPSYVPDFTREIQPILVNAYQLWWVTTLVSSKHQGLLEAPLADPGPAGDKARQYVFSYMRTPLGAVPPKNGQRSMPKQRGDEPYNLKAPDAVTYQALTRTQYGLLRRWAMGGFTVSGTVPAPAITPHGLDRAALEHASGGAFYPGIEVSWQIRDPGLFKEPFRLDLNATSQYLGEEGQPIRPGHFSRQMALPWHADFNDCASEGAYAWWPAQRPDDAYVPALGKRVPWARPDTRFDSGSQQSSHEDMVALWSRFGFVLRTADGFVESERAAQIP